jgi:hypothetical protein
MVADFLRACGAGFRDIDDLLSRYTSQPVLPADGERRQVDGVRPGSLVPARPSAVSRQPLAAEKPKHVRTPEQQAARRRDDYMRRLLSRDVEEGLYALLVEHQSELKRTSQCVGLCKAGRRWFDIHWRTRARPKSRQRQLQKELAKPLPENVKAERIEQARQAMEKLAAEKIASPPPVPENARPAMLAKCQPADEKFLMARHAPQAAIDRVLGIRLTMFVPDISTWLESQGLVNRDVLKFRHGLLPQLMPICEATRDNPEERKRRLDEALAPWRAKWPQTDHVLEMFLERFERWKNYNPP